MQNQKVENDNPNEIVVRLVGKGNCDIKTKIVKKNKIKKLENYRLENYILENDLTSGNIKGFDIDGKTYFDGTPNVNYEIKNFSDINSYLNEKDFMHNTLSKINVSIYRKICTKKYFCSFDATINLNNFNETLYHVGNFKIIEDTNLITRVKRMLKEKDKKDKMNKNVELKAKASTIPGYSFKFKNLETGTEWKRLLKTMNSDRLSPIAQTLYLTCLSCHQDSYLTRDHINSYASNFTEQEREDGLNELINHGYFKDVKIRSLVNQKQTSNKNTKKPKGECINLTCDLNILYDKTVSSMAIGYYIIGVRFNEVNNVINIGVISKELFRKYYGWSSSQTDECFKELEKLGYIQKTKIYDENTEKTSNKYLFRKSLDQDFCDVEKEYPNYKIVKK